MKIDVSFNSERNETVIAALKNSHGDRCIIDRLCDEYIHIFPSLIQHNMA